MAGLLPDPNCCNPCENSSQTSINLSDLIIQQFSAVMTASLETLAELTSHPPFVIMKGAVTPGDGGGGIYIFDASSEATANGQNVVLPSDIDPSNPGRYIAIDRTDITPYNVQWFGAIGNDAADNSTAFQEAIDFVSSLGRGSLRVPAGVYRFTTGLVVAASNIEIAGEGSTEKWGQGLVFGPTVLDYRGTGPAITLMPVGTTQQAVRIRSLQLDGFNSTGTSDGLYFATDVAGKQITNCAFYECAFTNFSRYQVRAGVAAALSAIWGITFRDCCFHTRNRYNAALTASHLINIEGSPLQMAEFTFDDCVLEPFTPGTWAARIVSASVRFLGGTVTTIADNTNGSNGVWVAGGLYLYGTHLEGINSVETVTVGICVLSTLGHFISPAFCGLFGTGLQIGDPATPAGQVANCVVSGCITNNRVDVDITAGGSRRGTVLLGMGDAVGSVVVVNNRLNVDGSEEVISLYSDKLILPSGSAASPGLSFRSTAAGTGVFRDNSTGDLAFAWVGLNKAHINGTGFVGTAIRSIGNLLVDPGSFVGIGTATPSQTVEIQGIDGSLAGSLLMTKTVPRLQLNPFSQDNVFLSYDSFFDSTNWVSSSPVSNYRHGKSSNFIFQYANGFAVGSPITAWNTAVSISTTGVVTVGDAALTSVEFDQDINAGLTRMRLWDVDTGALRRVSVGAANSGGAGFKLLRIPN